MPKSPARDDLFAMFPDLPWRRHRTAVGRIERVRRQVRVSENFRRQRAVTERVRTVIAARRLVRSLRSEV